MVSLLTSEERESLRGIYENEFDSALPSADQANIVAVTEDGEIQAFITAEILIRVGMLWVKPDAQKKPSKIKQLIRYLFKSIPQGQSAIAIASSEKYESLFERIGMRPIEGRVFRIDL